MAVGDDLLELWSDRVPSLGQLLHIQSTSPLAIDPFFYHGLIFSMIRLFGVHPHLLNLPSLAGFLIMQVCLFYFVRRIASERAATFALAFPAITIAFAYTLQIRPYGVLLGLFGLAMLSWQTAVRRETHRAWALVVFGLSIAVAINTQYYGVLLMLPLCAAEAVRTWQRRRLDAPVLMSMGAGMAGIVLLLPFLKGAAAFRSHFKAGNVSYRAIPQAYNFLLLGHATFTVRINHLLSLVLGMLVVLMLWSCVRQLRAKTLMLPTAESVFLVTLAALPLFGFLLGHFVTHAFEPRYVLGAVIGIAALVSIALDPLFHLRREILGRLTVAALFAGFAGMGVVRMRAEERVSQHVRSYLVVSPEIKRAITDGPGKMLYTQDIDLFGLVSFHEADPDVRSHLALVYSTDQEMRWNKAASSSRTALNLKSFTPYTIVPYESVIGQPGVHLFVVTHGGWNWLDKALAGTQMQATPIGQALGGEVVSVRVQ
ncbi:MAG: glycosyltransferase family 39 protein [Acidobacteriaceae bacterium]